MSSEQPTIDERGVRGAPLQDDRLRQAPVQAASGPGATLQPAAVGRAAAHASAEAGAGDYGRFEDDDDWLEQPEELPRRPRRRLLTPLPLSLLGVLLVACGFIGGVLVEKGQSSSSSPASGAGAGLASRLAGLRAGASGTGAGGAGTGGASRAGAGGLAGAFAGAGGGATAGQVTFVSGSTLYVTTAEGNTVRVSTSPGSTVTKTVKASVSGIHPGETVVVTGSNTNGTISAESIRVGGGAGGGLGALGALLGGSGGGSHAGAGGSKGSGGEPALFGGG
jgi:hypothetical protein